MKTYILLVSIFFISVTSNSQSETNNRLTESKPVKILNKEYKTLRVGNQIWMLEDLDIKTNYHANIKLVEYYEMYYGIGIINYLNSESMKAKLDGWHVPSKEEWQQLLDYNKDSVNLLAENSNPSLNMKFYNPRGGSVESKVQFRKSEEGARINEYWTSTTNYRAPYGHEHLSTNYICVLSDRRLYVSDRGYHKSSKGLEYSYRVRLVKSIVDEPEKNTDTVAVRPTGIPIKVEETKTALFINGNKYWITKINGQSWLMNDIEYNGETSFTYEEGKAIADQIDGWEIPSITDWNRLLNYFGGAANKPTYKSFLRKGTFNGKKDCGYWSKSQYKAKEESKWVVGTWYKVVQPYAYKKTDKMSLRLIKK